MSMLFVMAVLSLSAPLHQDTSLITVPVFKAVLEHAAPRYPSRPGLRVVISDRVATGNCIPPCAGTPVIREIPREIVRQLQESNLIAGACRGGMGCPGFSGHTFIRMSLPFRLPSGYRVLPGVEHVNGILGPGPSFIGELVHVGVEVLVYGPCPKGQSCEYPDIVLYQYFLQEQPDGSYRVVSRAITGMV